MQSRLEARPRAERPTGTELPRCNMHRSQRAAGGPMGSIFWSHPSAKDLAALVVLTGVVFLGSGAALLLLTRPGTDADDAIQLGLSLVAAGCVLLVTGSVWLLLLKRRSRTSGQ